MHVDTHDCPLKPRHIALLQMSSNLGGTTKSSILAEKLFLSSETVRGYWSEIEELMDVHEHSEALYQALERGWIKSRNNTTGLGLFCSGLYWVFSSDLLNTCFCG